LPAFASPMQALSPIDPKILSASSDRRRRVIPQARTTPRSHISPGQAEPRVCDRSPRAPGGPPERQGAQVAARRAERRRDGVSWPKIRARRGSSFCVTLICALAFATHAHIKAPAYCRYFDRPTHRRKSWPRPSRSHVTCPRRHPRPVGPLSAHRLTSSRQPSRQCRNRPRSAGPAPSRPV